MWRGLLDLLWPSPCPVCDRESEALVHAGCLASIAAARLTPGQEQAAAQVHSRFEDGPGWFRLLHQWKYGGRTQLAAVVAMEMARDPIAGITRAVLIPMPDDSERQRQRCYSPVGDLARELALRTGARLDPRLLRRRRAARSQTACATDRERARNVARVFAVGDLARWPVACPLILVDDQVTSGASLRAAAVLLGARGNPVRAWCAARAARAPLRLS